MTANLRLVERDEGFAPLLLPEPVRYVGAGVYPLTELEPQSLRAHWHEHGPRPDARTDAARTELTARLAGLTGRGGAHFPVGRKWQAALGGPGPAPVVIANGAEGEPLSRKDAALLELRPHLVLDGLVTAAEAVGAEEAVVWLHEGDHAGRTAIARALAERAGRLDELPIRVAVGPDRYLSGEATAVKQAVSGGPPLPMFRRDPADLRGPDGRPAVVHNVDTLARVALVQRGCAGADSVLVSVSAGESVVVLEVPAGASVRDAVLVAHGDVAAQAVLLGGYGGTWLPWGAAARTPLHETALRERGRSLGAGVLGVLPARECGLARTAEIARFLADASARQCGPCVFGLPAIADTLDGLVKGGRRHRHDPARLDRFFEQVRGRGACRHPDGAVRLVASALEVFADDVAAHLAGRCLNAAPKRSRRG